MEHESNTVSYDVYLTSDNEEVYKLLTDLYHYHLEIGAQTNFTPHYITYQHPLYDAEKVQSFDDCLGGGRYCNMPGKFGVTDGRHVVKENLRQKCIYNYAYVEKNQTNLYWQYMLNFYQNCLNVTEPTFTEECSSVTIKKVDGLPLDAINKCIGDSYINKNAGLSDYELYSLNKLFEDDIKDRRTYLVSFVPAILINGRNFWGNWRADNVFEALCAGFKKKPEACYLEGAFTRPAKMSTFTVTLIVLLIIGVNVLIFCLCKNYIRRKIVERIESTDINHKINTVVTSYLALRDNNKV